MATQTWDVTLLRNADGTPAFGADASFSATGTGNLKSGAASFGATASLVVTGTKGGASTPAVYGYAEYAACIAFEAIHEGRAASGAPAFDATAELVVAGGRNAQSWDVTLVTGSRTGAPAFDGTLSFAATGTAQRWEWYDITGTPTSSYLDFRATASFSAAGKKGGVGAPAFSANASYAAVGFLSTVTGIATFDASASLSVTGSGGWRGITTTASGWDTVQSPSGTWTPVTTESTTWS